jgi:hypothetical protein
MGGANGLEARRGHRPHSASPGLAAALDELTGNQEIFQAAGVVEPCLKLQGHNLSGLLAAPSS